MIGDRQGSEFNKHITPHKKISKQVATQEVDNLGMEEHC